MISFPSAALHRIAIVEPVAPVRLTLDAWRVPRTDRERSLGLRR